MPRKRKRPRVVMTPSILILPSNALDIKIPETVNADSLPSSFRIVSLRPGTSKSLGLSGTRYSNGKKVSSSLDRFVKSYSSEIQN
jgi:hypothetical protein